jgi:sporulation protein YlmC with PRC-barrel domain
MLDRMIDDGHAIHYGAVERGTPVYDAEGVEVGKVDQVVDNYKERILDGIVIETLERELRFVDAPEVARTAERGVTLTITAAEVASLPPPERSPATFRPNARAGRLSRLLGRGWKRE